ncbi:hypothetical protein FHS27_006058 [Rhodopirellula rubra]|uniref:HAMP domain-containing protein n=1 Tax=Aporhodopirellula rubra TaxID=980271 RepID=A0A7W5E6M6_9BACT|nr:hypothetical protein [Aporhodopirellula rubra]MBB3210212.1 hypothetical protein [Aporhodopirellula rubra]
MSAEPKDKLFRKKRSRTVIDREVQYGVVWKIAVHWMALFACNSIALVIWIGLFEQPDVSWKQTVVDSFRRFLPFFVITAALIPAFVLDTLKLTNRFAGPISRLRVELANAAEGRPVRHLKFRNNDYWLEIANGFNTLIDRAGLTAEQNEASNVTK